MQRRLFLLGIVMLSSVGCFIPNSGGNYAHAYGGNIPLTLYNDLGISACYVHMSPSSDHNWGDDWLGPSEVIAPGASRTFLVGGGPGWDIQVLSCQHQQIAEAQRLPVMGPAQIPISSLRPGGYVQQQPQYVAPQQQYAAPPVYVAPQQQYAPPPGVYIRKS